ncbi:MAG: SDR family oxidoreductase [Gammaproteobacteria bacterium]|nr:SDR family oxidoreductase [Gammaproteobacteria bacterium]
MILFTGLTGAVGTEIVKLLPEYGISARGLVRNVATNRGKAEALRQGGVEIVPGDLADEAAVRAALTGCEQAFLLVANCREQLELEKNFVDRARQCGVRHIVKMSATGAGSDSPALLKRYHGEAEEYIRQSGLACTLVRPNFFMQNLLHVAAAIVAQDQFFMPMRDGQVGAIDVRDVAHFVLSILTRPDQAQNTWEITGPELLSFHDIAGQLSDVMEREISYVDVPPAQFKQSLQQWVPDDWYVQTVSELFELIAQGSGALLNDEYTRVTGRTPTSLRQFCQDYASFFEKG